MRLAAIPQNFKESIALAAGLAPTPVTDKMVALLLAKTVIAATAIGSSLETEPLTAAEIAARCGSDPKATEKLVHALFACKYLRYTGNRFRLAPVSHRWILKKSCNSLHQPCCTAIWTCDFMNFEEYVKHGNSREFHSTLSPEDWPLYHNGQADHATQIIDEVIKRIPLPPHARDLLDLGGGHGLYSMAFCRRYRNLRARVLDLAITVGDAGAALLPDGADHRVQFEVADIRTVALQPNSADVILLANVVHHFDEPTNRSLMERIARALRPGGIAIVIDAIRPSSLQQTGQVEGLLKSLFWCC